MHALSSRRRGRPKLTPDRGQPRILLRRLAVQEYIVRLGGIPTQEAYESTPHLLNAVGLLSPESLEKILLIDHLQGILKPRSYLVRTYRERITTPTHSAWKDTNSGMMHHRVRKKLADLMTRFTPSQQKNIEKLLTISPWNFIQYPLHDRDVHSLDQVLCLKKGNKS